MEGNFEKIADLSKSPDNSAIDKDLDTLQKENQELKEKLIITYSCFILTILIMFNSLVFPRFESWGSAIVMGVLEILLLLILGTKLDITEKISFLAEALNNRKK